MKNRRRKDKGLALIIIGLFALVALSLGKAFKEGGADAAKGIAETLAKGTVAAVTAAFAARWIVLRLGLAFLAPWAAGAVAIAAFMAVGAWDVSAAQLGLPRAPGALTGGEDPPGGGADCEGQLKYYDAAAGVWRCAAA